MGDNRSRGREGMMLRSVRVSWIISYSVILLIPVVISVTILMHSRQILANEVSRSNEALLKQVQQVIDAQISDIMRMGTQLSVDGRLITFMNYSKVPDATWRLAALDFTRMFTSMRVANSFIRDFYVYMPEGNIGLTSSSVMDKDLIYQMYHQSTGLSQAEWERWIGRPNVNEIVRMTVNGDNNKPESALVYVRSLVSQSDQMSSSLLVVLDSRRFEQLISSVKLEEESTVFIANRNDQVLFTTHTKLLADGVDIGSWNHDAVGEQAVEWEGEKATVAHITSSFSDWSYYIVTPTRVYASKVTTLRNLTILGFLLSVGLSTAALLWFTKRNYRPIGRMMEIVSHNVQDNLTKSRNELSILQQVMKKTMEDLNDSDRKLRQSAPLMQANLLGRLLKGRTEFDPELQSLFDKHRLGLDSDAYSIVLIHVEDYRQLFRSSTSSREDIGKKLQFVQLILANIIGELLGMDHAYCYIEVDGMAVFLVNPPDASKAANARLIGRIKEAQTFIQEKFYLYFSVGVSDIHCGGVGVIPHCYEEALEALEYRLIRGTGAVIPYETVKSPKEAFYYPIELERRLINFIAAGDLQHATEVTNEILMTNFSGGTLSIELAKCLMFEIISTVLKATEHLKSEPEGPGLQRVELIKRFLKCDSFEEIETVLHEVLAFVCRIVQQGKDPRHTDLKNQIEKFIQARYADGNLSLSLIAEQFGLHPTYVSKFFKQQSDTNVIDYINQYRIDVAKPMLHDASVQEVSERVGFLNANSFIRVFKKYEGITPGQYKAKMADAAVMSK